MQQPHDKLPLLESGTNMQDTAKIKAEENDLVLCVHEARCFTKPGTYSSGLFPAKRILDVLLAM